MMQFRQCVRFAWLRQVKIAYLLSISSVGLADEIVSLKDGREVRIRDNYTWEYLKTEAPASQRNTSEDLETKKQLDKWLSDTPIAFVMRHVELNTAWIRAGMGEDPNGVQRKIIHEKKDADLARGKTGYEELTFRLRQTPKAQEALTEFYLFWKSSMDQIGRTSAESERMYKLRMHERERGLQERKDRIILATSFLPSLSKSEHTTR